MSLLEVRNVSFAYGEDPVLRNVSFDVDQNSMMSILGPNGVGKTTLLKCLCNLHRPDSGQIFLDGRDILEMSPKELARVVAYVPQKASVSKTTVFDSILIGRKPHMSLGMADDDLEKTWRVIEDLELEDIYLKNVDEISGGQFQMVQIARAIVQEPKLLILDEPSNNLDISNQHITLRMIEKAVRGRGLCTIMTMHDINLAAYYSDRFLFVKQGRVHSYGGRETITPENIKSVYGIDVDVIEHKGLTTVIPLKDE
ncbi:MAG: ABC transporter ATP-binding protein [archaeon]|nr:ABC transporter ATP-binding protein [archaeon]